MIAPPSLPVPCSRITAVAVALGAALFVLLALLVAEVLCRDGSALGGGAVWLSDPRFGGGLIALLVIAGGGASILFWRERERTRSLEMQAQSDSLLRQFYDLPFIGIAWSSPTSRRWLKCNDRLCEIFGYSRAEMTQMTWPEMTHPDDLLASVTEMDRIMRGESDGYLIDKRFKLPQRQDGRNAPGNA